MNEIWNHFPEYPNARAAVQAQPLEDDLRLIDDLFGRDELKYGATPEQVKQEALRQLEIEFRSERNERSEFWVNVMQASYPVQRMEARR